VKLFGRVNRGRRFTRLNLAAMLRGDMGAQSESLMKQVNAAITTPNEAREYLDKNPISGGDELLVQGAMIPLKQAMTKPAPPAPGTPPPKQPASDPSQSDPNAPPANIAATFGELLSEVYRKLFRNESDKAKNAIKRGELAGHVKAYYGDDTIPRVAGMIRPVFAGFLMAAHRRGSAETLATDAATRHIVWNREILSKAGAIPDDWLDRAPKIAEAELKMVWENTR